MAYASRAGRAIANTRTPQAFAVCDRCGLWWNRVKLKWQYQYAGNQLTNLRLLVCRECLDIPQPQLKTRNIPPDPIPIRDPRVENFAYDNAGPVPPDASNPGAFDNSAFSSAFSGGAAPTPLAIE